MKLPGTFRGAPFFVVSVETGGGRRTVRHEYPKRDRPFSEDMGLKGRTFSIECHVLGTEYEAARDKLLDALEKEGPGELVHPYRKTSRVCVTNFHLRQTSADGGIATFSIDFEETPAAAPQPTAVQDATSKVKASASAATLAVGLEFISKYSPGSLLDSVTGALRSVTSKVNAVLSRISMETQALARLKREAEDFSATATELANTPGDLLDTQIALFEGIGDGLIETVAGINPLGSLLSLYAFDPGVRPPATTVNRIIERQNFDAAARLTQRLVMIQAARVAVELTFESYDAASATRDLITDLIDEQAEIVADDVYPALMQLRADLVNAVPGDALEQARLLTHTPAFTVPSLVLAHRLYGNLDRESDLVLRNRTRNPMFLIGGNALEVLSR